MPNRPALMRVLAKRADFVRLKQCGSFRFHRPAFLLQFLQQESCPEKQLGAFFPVRVGFTATKKLGKAHQRNRAKRRMRALWRTTVIDNPALAERLQGHDCILIARKAIFTQKFAPLQDDLHYSLVKSITHHHPIKSNHRRRTLSQATNQPRKQDQ